MDLALARRPAARPQMYGTLACARAGIHLHRRAITLVGHRPQQAIFSVVNGIALRDLPAPAANELVAVYQLLDGVPERNGKGGRSLPLVSLEEYRTYREETLSGVMGLAPNYRVTLGGDAPREIAGTLVTCNYFDVLRQPPAIGRGLVADDCAPGAAPVVVLGHEQWATEFGANPAIVGDTIVLNRQPFRVVGIAPQGIYGGSYVDAGWGRTAFLAPVTAGLGTTQAATMTDTAPLWSHRRVILSTSTIRTD